MKAAVLILIVILGMASPPPHQLKAGRWPAAVQAYVDTYEGICREANPRFDATPAITAADFDGDGATDYLVYVGDFSCEGAASLFAPTAAAGAEAALFAGRAGGGVTKVWTGDVWGVRWRKWAGRQALLIASAGIACGDRGRPDASIAEMTGCVREIRRTASGRWETISVPGGERTVQQVFGDAEAAPPPPAATGVKAFVEGIYAASQHPGSGGKSWRTVPLAPLLKKLIARDDALARAGGGVNLLDADPFCDCQDTMPNFAYQVTVVTQTATRAAATVRLTNGAVSTIRLDLVRLGGQWAVEDIHGAQGSLVRFLQRGLGPVATPKNSRAKKSPPLPKGANATAPQPPLLRTALPAQLRGLADAALCRGSPPEILSHFVPDVRGQVYDTYVAPSGAQLLGAPIYAISYATYTLNDTLTGQDSYFILQTTPEQFLAIRQRLPYIPESPSDSFTYSQSDPGHADFFKLFHRTASGATQMYRQRSPKRFADQAATRMPLSIDRDATGLTTINCLQFQSPPEAIPSALAAPAPDSAYAALAATEADIGFGEYPATNPMGCASLFKDKAKSDQFDAFTAANDWRSIRKAITAARCRVDFAFFWLGRAAEAAGKPGEAYGYYAAALALSEPEFLGGGAGRCQSAGGAKCRGLKIDRESASALMRLYHRPGNLGPYPLRAPVPKDRFIAMQREMMGLPVRSAAAVAMPEQRVVSMSGRTVPLVQPGGSCSAEGQLIRGYCFDRLIGEMKRNPGLGQIDLIITSGVYPLGARVPDGQYDHVELRREGAGFSAKKHWIASMRVPTPQGCLSDHNVFKGYVITVSGALETIDFACTFLN